MSRRHLGLLGLGGVVVVSTLAIARLGDLGERAGAMLLFWGAAHLAYVLASWMVVRSFPSAPRATLPIVLAVGLLARFILIPTPPTLSEDLYRYLWDGRLVAHGVNPYPHAPSDPALERFQGELLRRLNHANIPTIYPPGAQLLFAAAASVSPSPVSWKLLLFFLELGLCLSLLGLLRRRGLPGERLLLYYWNPLVLVESFGQGHVDLAAAAFLVLAISLYDRRRDGRAGFAFGLAILTKLVPALLVPWLIRRRAWVLLATALAVTVLLTAPFLAAGSALLTGLRIYARHWEFNGALYHLLREVVLPEIRIRWILGGAAFAAALVVAWRARSFSLAAMASLVSFLIASPTVFPWYLVPAVALLPLHPEPGLIAFSGLVALSYLPLPVYRETGVWTLPRWILWVEYGGLFAAWATALVAMLVRRSGARVRVDQREDSHVEKSKEVQREKG